MKKINVFVMVILAILVSGCGPKEPPKSVLQHYIDVDLDPSAAYSALATVDREYITLEEFYKKGDFNAWNEYATKHTTSEITEEKIDGEKALYKVKYTLPNENDIYEAINSEDMKEKSEMDKYSLLESKYSKMIGNTSEVVDYTLILEEHEWKVLKDFKAKDEQHKKAVADYKGKVVFSKTEVSNYGNFTISGYQQNIGDISIRSLVILVKALDDNGKTINEKEATTVFYTGEAADELQPNEVDDILIWYDSGEIPNNWSKKFIIEVKDIIFAD